MCELVLLCCLLQLVDARIAHCTHSSVAAVLLEMEGHALVERSARLMQFRRDCMKRLLLRSIRLATDSFLIPHCHE